MSQQEYEALLSRLEAIDPHYETLFPTADERAIWAYAAALIDDVEHAPLEGVILLCCIGAGLPQICDQAQAAATLLFALRPTADVFVFDAAQRAALAHAMAWSRPTARQFAQAFARAAEQGRGGDIYLRTLALEGAALVPLLHDDVAAIGDTVTLLLSALAPLPVAPGDAAFVPVKVVKLLARCFELVADDRIVPAVRALVDAPVWAVAEEARAMLALVLLHAALRDARDAFTAASLLDESAWLAIDAAEGERPDAELLVLVARTLLVEVPAGSWKGHVAWRERARELLFDLMRVFRETRDPPPPEETILNALRAVLTAH